MRWNQPEAMLGGQSAADSIQQVAWCVIHPTTPSTLQVYVLVAGKVIRHAAMAEMNVHHEAQLDQTLQGSIDRRAVDTRRLLPY